MHITEEDGPSPITIHEVGHSYADSLSGCTEAEAEALMAECRYVLTLIPHDWSAPHSAERDLLRIMQRTTDPAGTIWNRFAHPSFRIQPTGE